MDATKDDLGRFHAQWRRQTPPMDRRDPDMPDYMVTHHGINLSDEENYLILEAEGAGQFIGCNLNINTFERAKKAGNWYGEGDEMIFVDDDNEGKRWPPTLHGTGTEDYFNTAGHATKNIPHPSLD